MRWEDVVDVRPNTAAQWADHVVVRTADGERLRFPTVPAADVDAVRRIWQAALAEPDPGEEEGVSTGRSS